MKKNINFKNIMFALNAVSAIFAFVFGFSKAINSAADGVFFVSSLKFLAGSKTENAISILLNNYSIAFLAYIFSSLTFGITGIFFLFSSFLILGVTATKTTSICYLFFILFESLGFLLCIYFSIKTRHLIKSNGFKNNKHLIAKDLFYVFVSLVLDAFFESIVLV